MVAYTPGKRAFVTLSGNGLSQRSGFHSSASGPQMRVERLALKIEMTTSVFFFRGIADISRFPSADLTGQSSGRTISSRALTANKMSASTGLVRLHGHVRSYQIRDRRENSQCLAANCVKIRKTHKCIIVEISVHCTSFCDFFS